MEPGPRVVGYVVNYTCDTGYQFSNMNTQRTCMIDQTWSKEDISCEKSNIAIANVCTSIWHRNVIYWLHISVTVHP